MSDNATPNGPLRATGADDLAVLRAENEKLSRDVAELRKDKRMLMQFVANLLHADEQEIDAEALLKEFGREPPLEELIAELERMGTKQ